MPALNFVMQYQQRTNWCWAAVTVSVDHYYTPASGLTQCTLVNQILGRGDCCQNALGPWIACNSTGDLAVSLAHVGHLAAPPGGLVPAAMWGMASLAQIQHEIDNLRPLGIRVAWLNGGAHAVACTGYWPIAANVTYLTIQDPWYGTSLQLYGYFPLVYANAVAFWSHTYFTH